MSSRLAWVVALGAALGLAAAIKLHRSGDVAAPREAPTNDIRSVERPNALSAAPSEEPARAAAAAAPIEEPADKSATRDETPLPPTPSPIALALLNFGGTSPDPLRQQLEAFEAEPRDPEWSPDMEARILAELSQWKGLAVVNLQAECRTTVCAVLLVHAGGASADSPLDETGLLVHHLNLSPRPSLALKGPDGAVSTWAFLGRVTEPPPHPH
jgi:hypothetical protein